MSYGNAGASRAKPYLLFVFPGPIHEPEDYFGDRLTRLSRFYEGGVLTTGDEAQSLRIADFDVLVQKPRSGNPAGRLLELWRAGREILGDLAERGGTPAGIVSYDPLKSGLLAWALTVGTDAKLIVQLNGDYTADATFADLPGRLRRGVKKRLFRTIARLVLGRADGVKALHAGLLSPFREALKPTAVVEVFPDYVDLRDFRDLGEEKEVLFVGHPFYLKGVDVLVAAFKEVSDEFPDWRLKVLGWFPDPEPLRRAVGGHPRIQVHPPVGRSEVARHMGRCGIFVLPSRTEAMGRVLLEAMACGKPRIASRVGGIPRVVDDGDDGLLVPPGDAPALAGALRRLMGDAALRRRLGAAGLARVSSDFSGAAYLAQARSFYDAVLGADSAVEGTDAAALGRSDLP